DHAGWVIYDGYRVVVIGSVLIKKCKSANLKKSKIAKLRFVFEAKSTKQNCTKSRAKSSRKTDDCERKVTCSRHSPTISVSSAYPVPSLTAPDYPTSSPHCP